MFDQRVAITISKIISDFFAKNDDALIFTCDNYDKKHQYRDILFERWYNKYSQGDYIKHNRCSEDVYSSIICYRCNPLRNEIFTEFNRYFDELNEL